MCVYCAWLVILHIQSFPTGRGIDILGNSHVLFTWHVLSIGNCFKEFVLF